MVWALACGRMAYTKGEIVRRDSGSRRKENEARG